MRAVEGETWGLRPYLEGPPVFCFTTDLEWSPEWAIRDLYELAAEHGIPLTPFVTHVSPYLVDRLRTPAEIEDVGLHPNFLPGSTHGTTTAEVIETVTALWPSAVSYRAHCQYDDARMSRALARRGFKYESNMCHFLQPLASPLRTHTSLVRFPIFWEDDVHTDYGLPWELGPLEETMRSSGLKVINIHPMRVALNVPSEAFYDRKRSFYANDRQEPVEWRQHVSDGPGTRTMLVEIIRWVQENGYRIARLSELYRDAVAGGLTPYRTDGTFRSPTPAERAGEAIVG